MRILQTACDVLRNQGLQYTIEDNRYSERTLAIACLPKVDYTYASL